MSKKKTLLAILSAVIICSVSIMGTLAYLTKTSTEVNNTFVAAGGGDIIDPPVDPDPDPDNPIDNSGFFLFEHKAIKGADGSYTLAADDKTASLVKSNNYDLLPGVNVPKDPFIQLNALNQNAYAYVEIVDGLGDAITNEVHTDWTELAGVTGKNGGKVYVYKNDIVTPGKGTNIDKAPILKDNLMTINANGDVTSLAGTLKFYGYLCQATGFTDATVAFNACFPTT